MSVRGNIEAVYPLTPIQDGILFHVLYAPESPLYFQQYSAAIEGPLEVDVFRRSWDLVISRHEALRSLLTWERREQPLQIVRGTVTPEWRIEDWSDVADPERRLAEFLAQDRERGFDLAKAPLMRFALFRTDDGSHRFVWSHHHVVIDGWSMGIVLDEVFRSYAALAAGAAPELPPAASYRNYVAWLQQHDPASSAEYWRKLLAGFPHATPLPIERAGMASPWAVRHAEQIERVPADRTAALAEAMRRNGLTLNTLLRGAWALVLHRYSGQDDLVFGATSAGRPPAVEGMLDMVGMFINTLPVRVHIDPDMRSGDWLQSIQEQQLSTSAHETTPLADVQRWSEVPQGDPLFTTLLVFENVPTPATTETGIRTADVRYLQRSNYPLAILVMPGEELELIFLYDADRFEGDVIARMARQLAHAVERLAAGLDQPLGAVDVIPPAELEQILGEWNGPSVAVPDGATMHELIFGAAAEAGERVAVTDGAVAVTYRDLVARAEAIAAALRQHGAGPGTRVGVAMPRSPAMIVAILGVLAAGAAYVPIDPEQPAARRRYVLDDTDAVAVIVASEGEVGDDPARPTLAVTAGGEPAAGPGPVDGGSGASATADDLAYVLFTSGSTGRPKGVAVTHRNLVASTHVRRSVYPGRVDTFLLVSPLIFDSSLVGLFWTLYDGGTIVLPQSQMEQDVRHLAGLIHSAEVTHTLALPSLYELILEHAAPGQLATLQVVMVAGEACPPPLVGRHHAALPQALLVNEYGPTEATVWCTAHVVEAVAASSDGPAPRVPIGRPTPNTQCFVLDERLRPVPVGVPGELCVAGAGVAQGYLNHPELTEERFVEGQLPVVGRVRLYRTGDVVRHLPDGTLDLLGRRDHQVKIRGQRIELTEIETVLRTHPRVTDAVVVVHEESAAAPMRKTLVAYAVTDAAAEALRAHLAELLPDAMVPGVVVVLEELPRGATGKIDRRALPAPSHGQAAPPSGAVAPQNGVERTLAGIWAEVLGLDEVGVTDNFFELGGDSILSIRIIARAHEAGLTISPRQFFTTPTVAELAAALT